MPKIFKKNRELDKNKADEPIELLPMKLAYDCFSLDHSAMVALSVPASVSTAEKVKGHFS